MRLDPHTAFTAVVLTLLLGVITVVYMAQFPPPPPPTVSCTAATTCTRPDQSIPDYHLDRPARTPG